MRPMRRLYLLLDSLLRTFANKQAHTHTTPQKRTGTMAPGGQTRLRTSSQRKSVANCSIGRSPTVEPQDLRNTRPCGSSCSGCERGNFPLWLIVVLSSAGLRSGATSAGGRRAIAGRQTGEKKEPVRSEGIAQAPSAVSGIVWTRARGSSSPLLSLASAS